MILHAHRHNDTKFVARAIKEHKLSPVPLAGFHADPTYWQETSRYLRVIEKYPWGAVLFVSDRERGEHVTVVAVGKVNLARGTVSSRGSTTELPVPWYAELVEAIASASPQPEALPPCFGHHESDHVCDGGTGPDGAVERACAWRDHCVALQGHAARSRQPVDDLIRGRSREQLVQLTTRLLGKVPLGKVPDADHDPLRAAVATLAQEVAELAGARVSPDGTSHTAAPGDLYLHEAEGSGSIAVYQATEQPESANHDNPRSRPVGLFRPTYRGPGLDVRLPLEPDHHLLAAVVRADVRPPKKHHAGAWRCTVVAVQPGQRRMDIIRQALVAIVRGEHESEAAA